MYDRSKTQATHKDRVTVKLSYQLIWFGNVYYVPSLHSNVMSCLKLDEQGILTIIIKNDTHFMIGKKVTDVSECSTG